MAQRKKNVFELQRYNSKKDAFRSGTLTCGRLASSAKKDTYVSYQCS